MRGSGRGILQPRSPWAAACPRQLHADERLVSEKYGKSLESLLPSREIPAEELNLSQSAEKQRHQTQPRLAAVKQTIYLRDFLKDRSTGPFTILHLNQEPVLAHALTQS